MSGLKPDLDQWGYDINKTGNVVLFPSTLQGACYLRVQLHRGNHPAVVNVDSEGNDSDEIHPVSYHAKVKKLLRRAVVKMKKRGDACELTETEIQTALDEISDKVLNRIKRNKLKLTNIAEFFEKKDLRGCCGVDSIPAARELNDGNEQLHCPIERNHRERQGEWQNEEEITYDNAKHGGGVHPLEPGL